MAGSVNDALARHAGAAYSSHSLHRGRATTTLDPQAISISPDNSWHASVATTAGYDGRYVLGRGASRAMTRMLMPS